MTYADGWMASFLAYEKVSMKIDACMHSREREGEKKLPLDEWMDVV